MLPDNVEVPEFGKYYYKGIQPLHLHYPLYNEYFGVEDMEHFTIVRNPFDRFKSALKGPLEAFPSENPDTSYNYFFKNGFDGAMELLLAADAGPGNNWFRPQHEFVSETTHVWKLEDGLGDNFIKWVWDNFNVKLKVGKPYDRADYDYIQVFDSVNKYKSCVEEHYKKDLERFDY